MNLRKLIIGNHLFFGRDGADNYVVQVGTVAVTNGSPTVTGAGTTFTGIVPGTLLFIAGRKVPVLSVTDATHLVLAYNWAGATASGLPWWEQIDTTINFNTKPATEVAWISVGDIEDMNFNPKRTEEEVFSPSPGNYRLSTILVKTTDLQLDFTLQDMSELFLELLTSSIGPIVSAYQPYTGSGVLTGWFRVTQFSQADTQNNILEVWGRATADATKFSNELAKGKISLRAMVNPLNSGILTLAA
jgi:hypothetical protein